MYSYNNFTLFKIPPLIHFICYLQFFLSSANQNAGGLWGIYVHIYIFNITSMNFCDMVMYFNHLRILVIQMSRFSSWVGLANVQSA